MVTPADPRCEGFPYALDNGAWTAHCKSAAWDRAAFERAMDKLGDGADFVVLPDIVAGGLESLYHSLEWLDRLRDYNGLFLLAVQDGMRVEHIEPFVGKRVGVFVGGTTDWKLDSLPSWARLAHKHGAYLHVGRVNTARRIRYCSGFGVHSFDGTSASRYATTVLPLDFARRQSSLDFERLQGHETLS